MQTFPNRTVLACTPLLAFRSNGLRAARIVLVLRFRLGRRVAFDPIPCLGLGAEFAIDLVAMSIENRPRPVGHSNWFHLFTFRSFGSVEALDWSFPIDAPRFGADGLDEINDQRRLR